MSGEDIAPSLEKILKEGDILESALKYQKIC